MLAALRLIQQISYPLYGSVSILWLILWCLSAMRYISYVHWKDSLTLCLLLVIFFIRPYLSPFASVTMLDVGQGDCTLIITPYHKEVILIDVMGHKKKNIPKEIIVPYLHAQGIYHLDKIIVTHADMDPVSYTHLDVYKRQELHARIIKNCHRKTLIPVWD